MITLLLVGIGLVILNKVQAGGPHGEEVSRGEIICIGCKNIFVVFV